MCAVCERLGINKHPTDATTSGMSVLVDEIRKEKDARTRVTALNSAIQSVHGLPFAQQNTREIVKRSVVFYKFLSGDIASADQAPE